MREGEKERWAERSEKLGIGSNAADPEGPAADPGGGGGGLGGGGGGLGGGGRRNPSQTGHRPENNTARAFPVNWHRRLKD